VLARYLHAPYGSGHKMFLCCNVIYSYLYTRSLYQLQHDAAKNVPPSLSPALVLSLLLS